MVAVAHDDSFLIALLYGERTDWLKNVLAKGSATLLTCGKTYQVDRPEVIPMAEATIYFRPREQRLHRQFHVGSALRLRRGVTRYREYAPLPALSQGLRMVPK